MARIPFFKTKKEEAEKKTEETKEEQELKDVSKKENLAWRYILFPHVTEKAAILTEKENQYVFKVAPDANKIEIKKAIEGLFGVHVEKVRIINVPKKKRRRGLIEGYKKGYKKAIVKIKKGEKIEILPR